MRFILKFAVLAIILLFVFFIYQYFNQPMVNTKNNAPAGKTLKIESPAFSEGQNIPSKYTCDGRDINPPLEISGIPSNAKSLVLIMDDSDAPVGVWDHWLVFNIAPNLTKIDEGTEPQGTPGKNSWGNAGYGGPCPGKGSHRYYFKIYAVDTTLDLPENSTKNQVLDAISGHTLDQASLMGRYEKKK